MAQNINATTKTSLATHRGDARSLVLFEFVSGSYGFHTGLGPITYNAVTYVGAGQLIDVPDMEEGINGEVISITLGLSAIPNSALSPDVLASIEGEVYHFKPVTIYTQYLDPDTGAVMSTELEWVGEVDQVIHPELVGQSERLEIRCSSRSIEFQKIGYRMRSNPDQKLVDPNDKSLRHATNSASQKILWGDKDPSKHPSGGGGGEGDKGGGGGKGGGTTFKQWKKGK